MTPSNGMHRITHDKISESALQSIKLYILDNSLKAGDALPSESELSETLGISRASIREAFRSLEALGIIVTAQGKGRFIRDFNYSAMLENLSYNLKIHVTDFRQIIDVRMALEESFLKMAMRILTEEDFSELERLLVQMQRMIEAQQGEDELVRIHTQFHQRLYAKLHNELLESLIGVFATFQRFLTVIKQYKTSNFTEFLALHRSLIEMLRSRDESRVHACLQEHFKDVITWSTEHRDHMI
ncbi:MAG: FCD domain-containing protein [Sphaerochaetaceae bacterium]|jgi:DNA-binding FadR family transcriptional regulator|nr:FCD domain-containing protein [Sphaerochaetaceae bacterium]